MAWSGTRDKTDPTEDTHRRRSLGRTVLGNGLAVAGITVLLAMVAVAVFAPFISPYDPDQIAPARRLMAPGAEHWFGTDHLGRDILSRVIYGTRTSVLVSTLVAAITAIVGAFLGLIAGYYKRADWPIMSIMDGLMAFPGILLAIALVASLGPSSANVIIALTIVYTPRVARTARATTLVVRDQTFVESAIAVGVSDRRIILKHILPNCIGPINVQVTFIFAYAILAEAALSFLGVGTPPSIPSWGNILNEGRRYLPLAPWITVFPGIAIMISVLGLNLLGDGLRDVLDPRLRKVLR